MQIIVKISDLYQHEIGEELFQELCRIYPEGNNINNFTATLPEEDDRVRRITAELERRGYQIHGRFGFTERPSYRLLKQRVYDQADLEAVPWLVMYPRATRSPEVERLPNGMLKLSPTHLYPGMHIADAASNHVIVSDHLRKLILDEGFENVAFLPTQVGAGRAVGRAPVWELRSTLLLPSLSPSIVFRAYTGEVHDEKVHLARHYYEGLFETAEMHYLKSDFERTPKFDIAETREQLWGQKMGLLIASQRFYRFCRDLNLDINWIPVRLDEVEEGAVAEGRHPAQSVEFSIAPPAPPESAPIPTLSEALDKLREFQISLPKQFQAPGADDDIDGVAAKTMLPTPQAWKEVWKVANGFELYNCVLGDNYGEFWFHSVRQLTGDEAVPLSDYSKEVIDAQIQEEAKVIEGNGFVIKQQQRPKKLPGGEHASLMRALRYGRPDFPLHYLLIGGDGSGDMIALDTSAINESGDCPVVLISHEYNGVEQEWGSVGEFLIDILTEREADEDEDEDDDE